MSTPDTVGHDESPQTYDGALEIAVDGHTHIVVGVHLSGFFQPIDGTFRWHGRTEPDERVTDLAASVGRKQIAVRVPGGGWTNAHLAEVNPWGGYRIAGRGRPPFTVEPIEVEPGVSAS
ncbi:MAG: DUF4873 domain-containing protein [Nocardioidaceae bacterium]